MSAISTHILDVVLGRPAAGVTVALDAQTPDGWTQVAGGETDGDGRWRPVHPPFPAGLYRLRYQTLGYFDPQARQTIFPEITIPFAVDGASRYHIPVLLSENSYTTYRGS